MRIMCPAGNPPLVTTGYPLTQWSILQTLSAATHKDLFILLLLSLLLLMPTTLAAAEVPARKRGAGTVGNGEHSNTTPWCGLPPVKSDILFFVVIPCGAEERHRVII